ncbi:MAG: sigma-70 family RNA polymerase sigma factor [Alphaproteobacteria bacterium]|nr:sigma-70 family RNA polymerase sigma factor [Alphaproteobacteria bacterium]
MSALMTLYLAKRADLVRFFAARTSSPGEAEDIVQDIFLKLSSVDDTGIENGAAYLYRLGSNVMLDRARARRRATVRDDAYYRTHRTGQPVGEDEADLPSPEARLDAKQRLDRLVRSVEALPPQCRRVFTMHKFEDRSYAEIATLLGISRSAVEKHMITALKRLSEHKP